MERNYRTMINLVFYGALDRLCTLNIGMQHQERGPFVRMREWNRRNIWAIQHGTSEHPTYGESDG